MTTINASIVNLYNDRNIEWVQYVRKMGHKYAPFWFDGCWSTDGIEKKILQFIKNLDKEWITAVHPNFPDSLMLLNIDRLMLSSKHLTLVIMIFGQKDG